jgi:hypothetical protein
LYGKGYLYLGIRASTPEMIVVNLFVDRGLGNFVLKPGGRVRVDGARGIVELVEAA